MKRLYYLADSIDEAEKISQVVHKNGISDWHFHVVSKDEAGLYQHRLHGTSFVSRTDLIHSGERGAALGLLAGLSVALFSQVLWGISAAVGFLMVVFFTCFGAWAGGLVGISHVNYRLARFQKDIDAGRYLIMIDIAKEKAESLQDVLRGYNFHAHKAAEDEHIVANPLQANEGAIFRP